MPISSRRSASAFDDAGEILARWLISMMPMPRRASRGIRRALLFRTAVGHRRTGRKLKYGSCESLGSPPRRPCSGVGIGFIAAVVPIVFVAFEHLLHAGQPLPSSTVGSA